MTQPGTRRRSRPGDNGVFDTRQAAEDGARDYPAFPFIGMDGETYELPHPLSLTTDQAIRLNEAQKQGDDEALMELFDSLAPAAAAAVRALPVHVTGRLMDAWYESAGDLGKPLAGSSPPNRSARRSKPT